MFFDTYQINAFGIFHHFGCFLESQFLHKNSILTSTTTVNNSSVVTECWLTMTEWLIMGDWEISPASYSQTSPLSQIRIQLNIIKLSSNQELEMLNIFINLRLSWPMTPDGKMSLQIRDDDALTWHTPVYKHLHRLYRKIKLCRQV